MKEKIAGRDNIVEILRRLADNIETASLEESNIDSFQFKQGDTEGHRVFDLSLKCIIKTEIQSDLTANWSYSDN